MSAALRRGPGRARAACRGGAGNTRIDTASASYEQSSFAVPTSSSIPKYPPRYPMLTLILLTSHTCEVTVGSLQTALRGPLCPL